MYLHKILKLFFFSLLMNSVQAADLNISIVEGNRAVYTSLLKDFNNTKQKNDETLLQEALLEKLLSFQRTELKKPDIFILPKDQEEAKKLLFNWFDILSKQADLEQQQKALLDKMTTLKVQIENIPSKDPSLLTYQLQYAFYVKNKKYIQKQVTMLTQEVNQIIALLKKLPKILMLDQNTLEDRHKKLFEKLSLEANKLKILQVKKERLSLLDDKKQLEQLSKKKLKEKENYKNISQELLSTDFLLFCDALQKKDQTALQWDKEILKYLPEHIDRSQVENLLKDMEREYLGIIDTISGTTVQGVKYTAHSIWKLLTNPLFEINETPVSIFKLMMVFIIFILGFLLGGLFKRSIYKTGGEDNRLASSSRMILANIGYYLLLLIAFFSSMKVLGINLSSLAIIAGALSVGIGFGLQNIVSNFVSGLILMFERSIKIGDYVQLDDNTRGHVSDIRMRSTIITTNDNMDIIVPNQYFIEKNVINWTMNDKLRRFAIPFGVKYGTKPQHVIEIILKAVNESNSPDIYTSRARHARVIMTDMGDSSVNFTLFIWIQGKEIFYPKRTTSRFMVLIYNTLYENNIEIPFPQRDLHIRSVDENVKINITSSKENDNEQSGK